MNASCQFNFFYFKLPDHRISLCTILGITAVTSTLLNSLVLFSVWKTPSLHKPSYILIANLALTDFLTGLVAKPMVAINHLTVIMNWKNLFCYILVTSTAIGYSLGVLSVITVTLISIDRFLAVKLNIRYRSTVTCKRVAAVLLFGWIATVSVVSLVLFLEYLSITTKIIIASIIVSFALTILTVFSSMAFYYLKKRSSSISPSNPNTSRQEAAIQGHQNINVNKYRRSLNTMLLVILCMLLFYMPLVVSGIVAEVTMKAGQDFKYSSSSLLAFRLLMTGEAISLLNSSVNPLLYLWRIQDLRRAVTFRLQIIFRRQMPGNQEQQVQS